MKASDIREKNDQELQTELAELEQALFKKRMQGKSGQGTRPDQFSRIRRDIARVKTIQLERLRQHDETESTPNKEKEE